MMCCYCEEQARKHGRDRNGNQRFKCKGCKRTFLEERERPLGDMRIDHAKAVMVLRMLAEGCSVRAIERLTDLHRNTICKLLVQIGARCQVFMEERIVNVPAKDVQCDEMWGFVRMKQRTKKKLGIDDPFLGDAYCFIAMERDTKLILAWHLGQRNRQNAIEFLEKLNWVTAGRFQVSTDAWGGYNDTVHLCLGDKADYATIEKRYSQPQGNEARYSPPVVVGVKRTHRFGNPKRSRICTSHIERMNCSIRQHVKRLARLTLCFSKKWENLKAALAWQFCYYNFCRIHGSLRVTPAMESGLTDHIWTVEEILAETATQ